MPINALGALAGIDSLLAGQAQGEVAPLGGRVVTTLSWANALRRGRANTIHFHYRFHSGYLFAEVCQETHDYTMFSPCGGSRAAVTISILPRSAARVMKFTAGITRVRFEVV
jgi:hypothetical protein